MSLDFFEDLKNRQAARRGEVVSPQTAKPGVAPTKRPVARGLKPAPSSYEDLARLHDQAPPVDSSQVAAPAARAEEFAPPAAPFVEPELQLADWARNPDVETRIKISKLNTALFFVADQFGSSATEVDQQRLRALSGTTLDLDRELEALQATVECVRFLTDDQYAIARVIEQDPRYRKLFALYGTTNEASEESSQSRARGPRPR